MTDTTERQPVTFMPLAIKAALRETLKQETEAFIANKGSITQEPAGATGIDRKNTDEDFIKGFGGDV